VPALRGKTVVNLFFEPSTRTRTSFEIAEKRLSADTLNIRHRELERREGRDAGRYGAHIEAMSPDMIVLRHSSSGACHLLSRICRSAMSTPATGSHEHPTQALLDAVHDSRAQEASARTKVATSATCCTPGAPLEHPSAHQNGGPTSGVSARPTADARRHQALGVQATSVIEDAVPRPPRRHHAPANPAGADARAPNFPSLRESTSPSSA
jgi:aspartate carbamoyltransferase catalytic subunit